MSNTVNSTRIELLTKDNYETWKMQVEAVLIKADLWQYVSGLKPKPEVIGNDGASIQNMQAWMREDQKAKADLILSISPTELKQLRGCETAREVWLKLEAIFASKGPARKATLSKQLTLQRMQEGDDLREHTKKFFDAVDKLSAMNVDINADLLSIMLLYSLPQSFENFRCAIKSRDNLPDVETLKVKITEENEARKQKLNDNTSGAMMAGPNWKTNTSHGNQECLEMVIPAKNQKKNENIQENPSYLHITTIFQRTSVSRGQLRIQGVATCLYLCMDSCGLLYGSVPWEATQRWRRSFQSS